MAYLWIGPSAIGKDPAINNGIRDFLDLLVEEDHYKLYNEITGPEFVRSVGQIFSKINNPDGEKRVRTLNVWNEFSSFAKMSGTKGTNTGIEVLNQAIDGYVQGRATVNRAEDHGSNVFTMVFAAGTPTFLKHIDNDFWNLGGATRFDILPYYPPELDDIPPTRDEVGAFKNELKLKLRNIRDTVKKVVWTPDMWREYLKYRREILTEVRKCQMSIYDAMDPDNYHIISKGKFPLKVLQQSVIHAIARHNYTQSGIVYVEIQDLERAKQDLERSHSHLMDLFNAYTEMDWKDAANANAKKVLRLIRTAKRRYKIKKVEQPSETQKDKILDTYYLAEESPDNDFVMHSDILPLSHLKASGYGSFEETINTLIESHKVGSTGEKPVRLYSKEKENSFRTTKFYRLKEE